jgi:two-component sensor histidine kinase
MSLVHEQLYMSENLSSIDFRESIDRLINKLFKPRSVSGGVSFHLQIDSIHLPIHLSIPLALIVNELIINALKHAFPGDSKGKIGIALHAGKGKNIELTVQDNGVGLPPSVRLGKTKTTGLHLVNLLVEQIEGSVTVRRKNGTAFKIVFPFENP